MSTSETGDSDAAADHGKGLVRTGVIASAAYLILLAWYSVGARVTALPPAELGTFLGGALSPLALAWVVLGFFQQGVELKNSVRALELQSQELRNSVEQQKALVDLTREQFEHERAERLRLEDEAERLAQPALGIQSDGWESSGGARTFKFLIANAGAAVTSAKFRSDKFNHGEAATWGPGAGHTIHFRFEPGEELAPRTLVVNYVDARGKPGEKRFRFTIQQSGGEEYLALAHDTEEA